MSAASAELHLRPAARDQIFFNPRPPPAPAPQSPIRQLQLHFLPAANENTTIPASQRPTRAPEPSWDHGPFAPATICDDNFITPTGDAHRIPAPDASDGCPPAPKKPRPSISTVPACRRRLIQGDLLTVPVEEIERQFGRSSWIGTATPTMTQIPVSSSAPAGPALLPAKKRKRCYAEAAA